MTERQSEQSPQLFIAEVREGAGDAVYGVRGWAWGIHWRAVAIAVCTSIIAYLQGDPTVLTASLTGLVILLIPRADHGVTRALIETALIKAKVIKQPPNESLLKPRADMDARFGVNCDPPIGQRPFPPPAPPSPMSR